MHYRHPVHVTTLQPVYHPTSSLPSCPRYHPTVRLPPYQQFTILYTLPSNSQVTTLPAVYHPVPVFFKFFFYLTLILLRLFQQHYCYNVTGQSQESEGSCKPARIKEVHSKLHSFQASLCTLTATHLTLIYVCTYIRLSVPLGCLIKQAGIIIHTILNMWETPGIEPVTSDLTSVYQISSSTNWAIPPHCQVNPVPITAW